MEKITLIHASGGTVRFPEVRRSVYTKDFSWGFYCTTNKNQAERWARRNEIPTLNYYTYTENPNLKILKFDEMTEEWLDFIAKCRNGEIHDYDIVEGPMADDKVWLSVNDFLDGLISREAFWALSKFKNPTHQISFHTLSALNCIEFERSEVLDDQ